MNYSETDLMAAIAAVTAIWMCGVSSIRTQLRILAVQTGAIAVVSGIVWIVRKPKSARRR